MLVKVLMCMCVYTSVAQMEVEDINEHVVCVILVLLHQHSSEVLKWFMRYWGIVLACTCVCEWKRVSHSLGTHTLNRVWVRCAGGGWWTGRTAAVWVVEGLDHWDPPRRVLSCSDHQGYSHHGDQPTSYSSENTLLYVVFVWNVYHMIWY